MKVDEPNPNSNKPIFFSKQKKKKINKKFNIQLFNKILYSFEISTQVLKKSSDKINALYTELSYIIENVYFNINKNSPLFK